MLRVAAARREAGDRGVVLRGSGVACRGGARALSAPAPEALSAWAPVAWAEAGLAGLQAASGLPWWATVVAAAALLRTGLTLPLSAQQGRVLAKLENLQPEIHGLARRLRLEVSAAAQQRGWSPRTAGCCFRRRLRGLVAALYVRENCHPAKASLLLWVQLPAWALVSLALRDLAGTAHPQHGFLIREQLSVGGALWFMDLTAPDHTLILPIMLGLLNLLIVEIFVLQKTRLSRFQKYTTHFFRGLSVLMVPVAATVPSAMSLYWVSSSFVGLSHNLLLRSPAFRRLCRIPRTTSDSDTPYRDIIAAFSAKYFLK
ncbi:cytochrome c oxidase assembly protein COX18, mitochondrial [Sphaerodactylus townsendi]|uniref:cytochrome c oxidase assembly protein COX18, mitochondrial n=1 Tax=Sphaerodactylus townsendi TaxID=933632 RepID=UPI0020275AE2|nr:cytochrome c oxidase assembly protein COX18, mitochondrial [Sphaerodactylus townsendi]